MTALEIYKAQYEEEQYWWRTEGVSKYVWAAHRVFDLTTYDDALDEQFVKDILEVCKIILDRENFEYIENEENYIKYILVCQLLDRSNWIEWGTSIRGAWFDVDIYYDYQTKESTVRSKDILDELEWWDPEHHVVEEVPFTVNNLKDLIKFLEEK